MKFLSLYSLFLFSLPAYGKLIYGKPQCNTLVGSKKPHGKIPTITTTIPTTYTITQEVTTDQTVITTPTVTITSYTSKVVKTKTVRRNQRPTIYITETDTAFTTTTTTLVETDVSTAFTTTSPPPDTTTVPTPAGYTPILSVDSHYLPKRDTGKRPIVKRKKASQTCSVDRDGNLHYYPPVYPTAVICTKTAYNVATTTVTVQGTDTITSTYTPPATTTAFITQKVTSTYTKWGVGRPTKITLSTTTTETDTETTTSTLLTTSTCTIVATPTPIVEYAMCSDDNIVSHVQTDRDPQIIQNIYYDTNNRQRTLSNIPSARECCNRCAGDQGFDDPTDGTYLLCAGSYWSLDGTCVLVSDQGKCNPSFIYLFTDAGSGTDGQRFFVSNG